jgi:NAD(P)-dependent dehydrogenase (short-subunit alcohol dehydrogenase family)
MPVAALCGRGPVGNNRPVRTALIIGGSDGIGLALSRRLLGDGWRVGGISRSASVEPGLVHRVADVRAASFPAELAALCDELGIIDVCVYCAGIGESLDLADLSAEHEVFEVNLVGAIRTIEVVLDRMLAAGAGHFVGLSSQADRFINADAPSYSGSKAGLSNYLEGLALACRPRGVSITNLRFGFVDTKMAKAEVKPFMVSPERAARVVERCLRKKPIRHTYPKRMAALMWVLSWGPRLRVWWS